MKQTHAVTDEGTVYCPRQRRVVDVMCCYGCGKLVEIDLDSRRPKVVCAVEAVGELSAAGR
ncbi:MAG TPA: hypothetical protein VFC31_14660 [Candidatus Limnocylindria bacterium]|nr:hypothetical protein [Candidatus Limnocylindria bacterium]